MTELSRLLSLKFGVHTSAQDLSSTPASMRVIEPMSQDFYPRDKKRIERNLFSADNRRFTSRVGPDDLSAMPLALPLRGVNGNTGGALTFQGNMEACDLLDVMFGAAAGALVGAAPTIAGGVTPNLTASSGVVNTGDMVLFNTTSGWYMREVVSGGTTVNLVLDRAYPGTVVSASTIFRSARWNVNAAIHSHIHGFFRAEWEDLRVEYPGCMAESLDLDFAEGNVVNMSTSWLPNDVQPAIDAALSYVGATAGQDIVNINAEFYIGDTEFLASSLKFSLKNALKARSCVNGVNGVHGYISSNKDDCVLSGSIYVGPNTGSIGEIQYDAGTPSFRDLIESSTTKDIALQVGGLPGEALYLRLPAAEIRGRMADNDGSVMFNFEAFATGASPARLGVF